MERHPRSAKGDEVKDYIERNMVVIVVIVLASFCLLLLAVTIGYLIGSNQNRIPTCSPQYQTLCLTRSE